MPLEIVYGESRDRATARELALLLEPVIASGTIYLGYPVLATADERVEVDALLVSADHGLVALLLADGTPRTDEEWSAVIEDQDRLFAVLESHLRRHESLRRGRQLALVPQTATVFPTEPADVPQVADGFYAALESVPSWVETLPAIDPEIVGALQAALQRVTTIKPRKRRASVEKPSSRGAILKEIERGIANLDQWQKRAAIESPEGPQRIRGLAGSGKTVVLALKAAYWHTQHPEWNIAFTFHSRALYQQIDDLVTRFTFEHSNDRPDPEHLKIIHSWGSASREGVYSRIAFALNETPRDWAYARSKYGMDAAFQGVCQELLAVASSREVEPIFDAVLIDEAQDLPPEFFQLVYAFTKDPKRIAWGYDELQRLSEAAMPDTRELFGTNSSGESLVSLESGADGPRRDIVLPVCYRNTPWALATAHAVGIGVYRENGLLQHPDEPGLWQDIGYDVTHGALAPGSSVTLERRADSYPPYFPRLLNPADAVVLRGFPDEDSQDSWVAAEIAHNLTDDELEHDDILIVLQDVRTAKSRAPRLMRALMRQGIAAHLVGVNTSVDEVFQPNSVAIAHIYRAKGNEAPMVYAVDTHKAAGQFNAVTRRNTLFTAITRSRAWVRITGWGEEMGPIAQEVETVFDRNYRLSFTVPTADELARLRHVYRDRPPEHEASVRRATASLTTFLRAIDRGDVELDDLPEDVRRKLIELRMSSE
jgi:superfamily I DNA and RNA helicase